MGNEIEISKTTALLLAGLFVVIVAGGYVAFGAGTKAPAAAPQYAGNIAAGAQVQDVYIKALSTGRYDNSQVAVRKGVPVRLHFSADSGAGCGKAFYLDEFNVRLTSYNGEDSVAQFTPQQEGTYPYHCGMWMFRGNLVVTS